MLLHLLLLPLVLTQPLSPSAGQLSSSLDSEFVLFGACALEARTSGGLDEEKLEACGECFDRAGDPVSEEGLVQTVSCVWEHLPEIGEECGQQVQHLDVEDSESAKAVLACFLAVVQREDGEEEVQEWVAEYLINSRDEDFIIGSACTLSARDGDGSFDEEYIGKCAACWEEAGDVINQEGLEAAKACVDTWMPDFSRACDKEIGEFVPGDEEQGARVFRCFLDHVQEEDPDKVVQEGVRDYLDKQEAEEGESSGDYYDL